MALSPVSTVPLATVGRPAAAPQTVASARTPLPPPTGQADEEWLRVMTLCFGQLDEGHQRILTLRTRFNLSYEEIAAELQTHVGAVRESIRHARGRLHALLSEHASGFGQEGNVPAVAAG